MRRSKACELGHLEQQPLVDAPPHGLSRRQAEAGRGLEPFPVLGDGEQGGVASRDEHVVATAPEELVEPVDEAPDVLARVGQPDTFGTRARPVGRGRATAGDGAHPIAGSPQAASRSEHGTLLGVGEDDRAHGFVFPAGSCSYETATAPGATPSKLLS